MNLVFFFFCTFVLFFADLSYALGWSDHWFLVSIHWIQLNPNLKPILLMHEILHHLGIAKEILSKEPDIQMEFFGYQLVFPRILSSSSPRCPHTESPRSSCSCLFRLSRNLAGIPPSKPSNLHWEAWKLQKMMRFTWGNHQLGVFCFFFVIFSWILPWDSSPLNHYLGELFLEVFPGIEQANPSFARATTPVFFCWGLDAPKQAWWDMNYEKGDDLIFYLPVMSNKSPPDRRKRVLWAWSLNHQPSLLVMFESDLWIKANGWLSFTFTRGLCHYPLFSPKK